jgi:hypothetical protein
MTRPGAPGLRLGALIRPVRLPTTGRGTRARRDRDASDRRTPAEHRDPTAQNDTENQTPCDSQQQRRDHAERSERRSTDGANTLTVAGRLGPLHGASPSSAA